MRPTGKVEPVNVELGFTFAADLRKDLDWSKPSLRDSPWRRARGVDDATGGFFGGNARFLLGGGVDIPG